MREIDNGTAALTSYRVLDLTDESGDFCTKILAALGADVIRIEPPGGHPSRCIGPFYHDDADPEKSLHWLTYNTNKKSITLDIECATGQEIFKNLAKSADFLVECFRPGYLDHLGLGYSSLNSVNPHLIHTSITPFGSTGPYSQMKGSNLVCAAMSGYLLLCGDTDRRPVQVTTPVAYIQTGLQAAAATLIADWYRQQTGEGQHIDVSAQEALMDQLLPYSLVWNSRRELPHRAQAGAIIPGRKGERGPGVFQCKDGFVVASTTIDRGRKPLRDWLATEGLAGQLFDKSWDPVFEEGVPVSEKQKDYINDLFQALALKHNGEALMFEAQRRGIQVAKVHSVRDVVENPHSRQTGYFVRLDHPELGTTVLYPGSPFASDEMQWRYLKRAPFIGEHNMEIFKSELGFSEQEIAALKESGVI